MPGSRLNAVLLSFSLFAVGCGQSAPPPPPAPSGPSLADQLAAAKELEAIAEEQYLQAVARRKDAWVVFHQIDESNVEARERFEKTIDTPTDREFQSNMELDEAKRRVRQLAKEMTAE